MVDTANFRSIPKRKLSEAEKQIIMLKIEKVRLSREKTSMILNKGVMLFFAFLGVAMLGVVNEFISPQQLKFLVVFGIGALVVGVIPYIFATNKEETDIEQLLEELTG